MDGDWSGNEKFPKGLAHLAQEVKMANGIPAIWFAPLMMHPEHPWGKENPEAIQSDAKVDNRVLNIWTLKHENVAIVTPVYAPSM